MKRAAAILCLGFLAMIKPALADTAATMKQFGLEGTWSEDCKANKPRLTFSYPSSGTPIMRFSGGNSGPSVVRVSSAAMEGGALKVSMADGGWTTFEKLGTRIVWNFFGSAVLERCRS